MTGNGKVFVSHTHADNARCEPLLAALDAWRVDYWYDAQQLDAGQQLSPRLQEAITQRDTLLRVCTVNTANSYWMNLEQSAFRATQYQHRRGRGAVARRSVDLVLDAEYRPGSAESADVAVNAVNKPQRVVLAELAAALGVKQREARQGAVSRRAALGLGAATAVTVASLAGAGVILKSRDDAAAAPYPTPRTIAFTNPQMLDPRIQWYIKLGDSQGAALALAGSRLLVSCAEGLFALDASDGAIQWWRPEVTASAGAGLVVVGDRVYTSSTGLSGSLLAAHVSDGSLVWKANDLSDGTDYGFTLANGVIYMVADDNSLVAFSAHNGAQLWKSAARINTSSSVFRTPVVDSARLYIGSDDGSFTAFSLLDGSRLWTYQTEGAVGYTAALANGVVYFGSRDQRLYALNTADGSLLWRYAASVEVDYTPAISGATVYIGLYDHIAALDAPTGAQRWLAPLDGPNNAVITGALAVADGVIYAPATSALYAFSAQTRQPLWHIFTRPGDLNQNTPLVAGKTLYWSGENSAVYALSAST